MSAIAYELLCGMPPTANQPRYEVRHMTIDEVHASNRELVRTSLRWYPMKDVRRMPPRPPSRDVFLAIALEQGWTADDFEVWASERMWG